MTDADRGSLGVTCRMERLFASSCLPRTMVFAWRFQADLVGAVANIHPEWPFEDRVLVWLLPNLEQDSLAFHAGGDVDMASLFVDHQLEHFDQVLSEELVRRLDQ